jgi:hypothetical protein
LGVRRRFGKQGRLRKPRRIGGSGRRIQAIRRAGEETLIVTLNVFQGPFSRPALRFNEMDAETSSA